MKEFIRYIINAVFPPLCHECGSRLLNGERILCSGCMSALVQTDYIDTEDNNLVKEYMGLHPIEHALALYYYNAGNTLSRIIKTMKYHHDKELCQFMGEVMASDPRAFHILKSADALLPVPLTTGREKSRGYNQSTELCRGICRIVEKDIITGVLERDVFKDSQTHKSAMERAANIHDAFSLHNPTRLENKHVVIIDDVITTTATTRECVYILRKIPGIKISVLALARTA